MGEEGRRQVWSADGQRKAGHDRRTGCGGGAALWLERTAARTFVRNVSRGLGLRTALADRAETFRAPEHLMPGPEFIDNLDGNTLVAALARVMAGAGVDGGMNEAGAKPGRLDIASAFFSPPGFADIADRLADVERIRLMIGAEPPPEARPP